MADNALYGSALLEYATTGASRRAADFEVGRTRSNGPCGRAATTRARAPTKVEEEDAPEEEEPVAAPGVDVGVP